VSLELSAVEGPLEEQQRQIESIQTRIPALSEALETVEAAEAECVAAKVEENDYTVFTCQDLEFELELVVQSIAKKISFIDNQACLSYFCKDLFLTKVLQIVSRNLTNLTPAQIEQFESTFRYFDKDETNTLNVSEMAAALASLGIVYGVSRFLSPRSCFDNPRQRTRTLISSTINCFKNMVPSPSKLSLTSWYVPLERILNVGVGFDTVQVEITEDQTSPDQLREAFQGAANNKVRLGELPFRSLAKSLTDILRTRSRM
jgi:cofilin